MLGQNNVLSDPDELLVYECDGLPQHKFRPRAVIFPSSTKAVSDVMRLLETEKVPFLPRGAGTGLSGGALAVGQGVVIELSRMRQILKIDPENRLAIVQPGVVNAHVSRAAAPFGLHYVPDPSSNSTCTIGGNIAENAGGIHCLKYGTTTDHVLGLRVVLAGGEVVKLGGDGPEQPGYDLLGTFVGSEGTFGVVTEATLRLVPVPPGIRTLLADFMDVNNASHAVSAIIAAGVMPAALEMMDHAIIQAVEASVFAAGLPLDADAALLIELDGLDAGLDEEAERVKQLCMQYGARACRLARDEHERKKLWAARKGAFGAIGRIAPDSMIQDAVVPRSKLPEVLSDVYRIASKYQLRIANVFHAGDGNLHPLICFDSRSPAEVNHVKEAGRELMETCVRAGGSISGEHGVGFDKRDLLPLIFSEADMQTMLRVRSAFDPQGLMNPGKIIPVPAGCGEARAVSGISPNVKEATAAQIFKPTALVEPVTETRASPEQPASKLKNTITVAPVSTAEVCEILRGASTDKLSLVPAGAGTNLDAGNQKTSPDLLLHSTFLNRIIEHEPADMIASAEAGVTLSALNAELVKRGQWLPLDPPDDGQITLGGLVATGMSGAQRFGYGSPRTFVIGMKVVLADGTLIKAGGRVVKNVAGYDLCKLFTGSYGSLGIITELTFKLRPVPQLSRTIVAFGSIDELLTASNQIIKANLLPVAVELLSPAFSAKANFSDIDQCMLLIRFSGLAKTVSYQASSAAKLMTKLCERVGPLDEDDSKVWRDLPAMPLRLADRISWRANTLSTDLGRVLRSLPADSMWHASVADGKVRVIEPFEVDEGRLLTSIHRFREEVEVLGGSLVVEKAPASIKTRIDAWGNLDSRLQLMSKIKRQLDPQGLMPERFSLD